MRLRVRGHTEVSRIDDPGVVHVLAAAGEVLDHLFDDAHLGHPGHVLHHGRGLDEVDIIDDDTWRSMLRRAFGTADRFEDDTPR